MDVLKDITDGLRKGDGSEQDESARDEIERDGTDRDKTDRNENQQSVSTAKQGHESNENEGHVCSFCETEFDAERETCPECDARIVLRGAR